MGEEPLILFYDDGKSEDDLKQTLLRKREQYIEKEKLLQSG